MHTGVDVAKQHLGWAEGPEASVEWRRSPRSAAFRSRRTRSVYNCFVSDADPLKRYSVARVVVADPRFRVIASTSVASRFTRRLPRPIERPRIRDDWSSHTKAIVETLEKHRIQVRPDLIDESRSQKPGLELERLG